MLSDIGGAIFVGALQRAWHTLKPDLQDALSALLAASEQDPENAEKSEAIDTFMKEHVPDWDRIVAEEAESFKQAPQTLYSERVTE